MRLGWVLGAVALLAAGVASVATPDRNAPARTPARGAPLAATEALRFPLALPERQMPGKAKAHLFAPRDWTPRAPQATVQAVQEPPPAPSVPPNPYRFAGTLHYGGSLKAVFIREDRVHIALPGETLDDGYKVLSVMRDSVTLLYTPLDTEQQIALAWDPAPEAAAGQAQPARQPNGAASSPLPPAAPLAVR